MPPLPPVTIATLPVKSKSGTMLRPPVLTLPAVAPTIPHHAGGSPLVRTDLDPPRQTGYCVPQLAPPYWRGSLALRSSRAQHRAAVLALQPLHVVQDFTLAARYTGTMRCLRYRLGHCRDDSLVKDTRNDVFLVQLLTGDDVGD